MPTPPTLEREAIRSRLATGLDRLRLLGPAARLREECLVRWAPRGPKIGPDGLPLPPPRLRLLVDGRRADWRHYLEAGTMGARLVHALLNHAGMTIEQHPRVLDFGCGCGRVVRHFAHVPGGEIHGCDYRREQVEWCRRNLAFLHASQNPLHPPTAYEEDSFDLIYALSVLTHMDEPLQHAWIREFKRLLRPGGILIFTTLGERHTDRLSGRDLARFENGELVVQRPRVSGTNACTAYHPYEYVTGALLDGFSPVGFSDGSTPGAAVLQDAYLVRAPEPAGAA